MAIEDDFSVAVNGDIRHSSGTTNYTVLELHRFLQDLADDQQASGNDLVDITSSTPSDRSTDNIITLLSPYNIDDDAAEYLYAGSISQSGGDTVYSGLRVLGAVNDTATQLMVIQDNGLYQFTTTPATPFWGDQSTGGYNGNAAAGILMRIMVKSRVNGADIDGKKIRVQARHYDTVAGDTYDFFNVTLGQGESVAAIGTTPDAQNDTARATVTAYVHVTNTEGFQLIDLSNGNGPQEYYSRWTYGADTSADQLKGVWEFGKDLTRTGTAKTIHGLNGELFLGITHSWQYDGGSGSFTEDEIVVWGTKFFYDTLVSGPFTPGNYVTIGSNGAAGRVLFDDGIDELIVALEDTSITLLDTDVVTEFPGPGAGATSTTAAVDTGGGATLDNDKSGGTAVLLALDDNGATGDFYVQVLTGTAPVDNLPLRGVTSAATALVNTAPTSRTVPKIFLGSYTGTLIGAYGIGFLPADLTANDSIEDLTGTSQIPPNNVTFKVTGLISGEDYVLVGPRAAGILEKTQDTHTALLTDNVTASVIMTTAIPTDTPSSGTIRVEDDNGVFTRQPYDSYTGSTYTLTAAYQGSDNANSAALTDVFISYIDLLATGVEESFTAIYSTDRDLFVRVRDGGASPIKTFEVGAVFGGSNASVAAIRTTDA